jgi:uncharacterized protein YciI
MPLFVKMERGIVPKAQFDRFVPAHVEYVRKLNLDGHQARSGYWGEKGGGMMLFKAASLEEARRIIEADPLVLNRCVEYELHQWVVVAQ